MKCESDETYNLDGFPLFRVLILGSPLLVLFASPNAGAIFPFLGRVMAVPGSVAGTKLRKRPASRS